MNGNPTQYDLSKCGQELSTLENIRDYIKNKIEIVCHFDECAKELSTLEHIKDYVQINIDIVMERYCQKTKSL